MIYWEKKTQGALNERLSEKTLDSFFIIIAHVALVHKPLGYDGHSMRQSVITTITHKVTAILSTINN